LSPRDIGRAGGSASSRDARIDVARGLGILLVVLGHNDLFHHRFQDAYRAVYLFHVPLFFFLSGYVFKPADGARFLRRTGLRLLLPFVAVSAGAGALYIALRGWSVGDVIAGIAWGTGNTLPWDPLWFLPALFVTLGVANWPPLRALSVLRATLIGTALFALGWLLMAAGPFRLPPFVTTDHKPLGAPWSLDLLPLTLLFAGLGQRLRASHGLDRVAPLVLTVAGAILLGIALGAGATFDLNFRRALPYPLALMGAIGGIGLALGLAGLLAQLAPTRRALSLLGEHSLIILLFHSSIQGAVLKRFDAAAGLPTLLLAIALGLLAGMLLPLLVGRFVVRRSAVASLLLGENPGAGAQARAIDPAGTRTS